MARHRHHLLAFREFEHGDSPGGAPRDANVIHRASNDLPAVGHQYDLIVVGDSKRRDHGVPVALQLHAADAFAAAPGDPVVVTRGTLAETILGNRQDELLVLGHLDEILLVKPRGALLIAGFLLRFAGVLGAGKPVLGVDCLQVLLPILRVGCDVGENRHRNDLIARG